MLKMTAICLAKETLWLREEAVVAVSVCCMRPRPSEATNGSCMCMHVCAFIHSCAHPSIGRGPNDFLGLSLVAVDAHWLEYLEFILTTSLLVKMSEKWTSADAQAAWKFILTSCMDFLQF